MSKTTVVIPNYRGERYIDDCLTSLYQGTVVPEVLVVDNASADGSLPLIREKYPRARIVEFRENRGFCAAANTGVLDAETPYVLLLNNDTRVDAHMVEKLEEAMEKDERIFSAAARMISLHDPEKLDGAGDFYSALGWAYARGKDKRADAYPKPCNIFSACAAAAIYRRKLFGYVGLFDENHFAYLEDVDIGYRANIYGYYNRYVPDAVVYHAGSAATGSRHNEFKVMFSCRNSMYVVYKNMPFLQILLNLPFLLAGYLVKLVYFAAKGLGRSYVSGLAAGVRLVFSKTGRGRRVRFEFRNLKNYIRIQLQLWVNLVRPLFQGRGCNYEAER